MSVTKCYCRDCVTHSRWLWKTTIMQIVVVTDPAELLADSALAQTIEELGRRSAVAQQLARAITSAELFVKHAETQRQQLLLASINDRFVGFLKTGIKHLFYVDHKGVYSEFDPLCVLDFYVHEDYQRQGIGLQLFSYLLEKERTVPARLAYDRPSPKLIAFLKKHANLNKFAPQPNNFVLFDEYFTK